MAFRLSIPMKSHTQNKQTKKKKEGNKKGNQKKKTIFDSFRVSIQVSFLSSKSVPSTQNFCANQNKQAGKLVWVGSIPSASNRGSTADKKITIIVGLQQIFALFFLFLLLLLLLSVCFLLKLLKVFFFSKNHLRLSFRLVLKRSPKTFYVPHYFSLSKFYTENLH